MYQRPPQCGDMPERVCRPGILRKLGGILSLTLLHQLSAYLKSFIILSKVIKHHHHDKKLTCRHAPEQRGRQAGREDAAALQSVRQPAQ